MTELPVIPTPEWVMAQKDFHAAAARFNETYKAAMQSRKDWEKRIQKLEDASCDQH